MSKPNIQWINIAHKAIQDASPDFFNQLIDPAADRLALLRPHLGEAYTNSRELEYFDSHLRSTLIQSRQSMAGMDETTWLNLLAPRSCCSTCIDEDPLGLTAEESLVLQRGLLRAHLRTVLKGHSAGPQVFSSIEKQIRGILDHTKAAFPTQ
jgi:hypothetical protein